jgi:sorting and assembly machinery component 37/metaxin
LIPPPKGELPLLKDGTTWVAGLDRILAHLVKRGKDGNKALSEEQKADSFA